MYEEITGGKKQLSLFVFWSPNQKGDWINFYHINEVTGEQSQLFSHVTDEGPVPWPQRNTSPCLVQVHQGHGSLLLAHAGNIRCAAAVLALFPFTQHIKGFISFLS